MLLLFQCAELEAKIRHLEAENVSLRAQLEDSTSKAVQALKEAKAKDSELESLRSQLCDTEKHIADLTKANQELSSSMARAEGTLQRAATLSGLDEGVRQEFNEVGSFLFCKHNIDAHLTKLHHMLR